MKISFSKLWEPFINFLTNRDKAMRIEIFPSMTCNLNCTYCDRVAEDSILQDFNDIKILYDNLKKDPAFNFLRFCITGKEPTLYPRINELIEYLSEFRPGKLVELVTNALELERVDKNNLDKLKLVISIYPHSEKLLEDNEYVMNYLKSKGLRSDADDEMHQDLNDYGTILKKDFDPLTHDFCLNVILLCGTKKVYPCCRAHTFERMYNKDYHYCIDTENLYQKLKNLIRDSDLCLHCPRMYKDCKAYPAQTPRKQ